MYLTIKIDFFKDLLEKINSDVQNSLKKRYQFNEIEIKKNEICFQEGIKIPLIKVKSDCLEIAILFNPTTKNDVFNEISNIVSVIGLKGEDTGIINTVEVYYGVKIESQTELQRLFINSYGDFSMGEIIEAGINMTVVREGKKIKYFLTANNDSKTFSVMSLISPVKITIATIEDELLKVTELIDESLQLFLDNKVQQKIVAQDRML